MKFILSFTEAKAHDPDILLAFFASLTEIPVKPH